MRRVVSVIGLILGLGLLPAGRATVALAAPCIGISTIAQLQSIGNTPSMPLTGNYCLTQTIDASVTASWNGGAGFLPIARSTSSTNGNPPEFSGTLDGQGHVIRYLTINDTSDFAVGLIGNLTGKIQNLGLQIEQVSGQSDTGGLVGDAWGGSISNSYTTGSVAGGVSSNVGGLAGLSQAGISDSFSTDSVTGGTLSNVGGLAGLSQATISHSYSTGSVTGGFAGSAGGLTGTSVAGISQSYSTGTVTSGPGSYVGGLVGLSQASISQSYSTGSATGGYGSDVGGLAGRSDIGISDSYSTGSATAGTASFVGGFVGYNFGGTISNSYSTGSATGGSGSDVGGFVGYNTAGFSNSFWDVTTSGTSTGVGSGSSSGVTGESDSNMRQMSTFTGASWTFPTPWAIQDGISYPYLLGLPAQIALLYTPAVPHTSRMATSIHIIIKLVQATTMLSSPSITVHAIDLDGETNLLNPSTAQNPGNNFTYKVNGSYEFILVLPSGGSRGFPAGLHYLGFTVSGQSPPSYLAPFTTP